MASIILGLPHFCITDLKSWMINTVRLIHISEDNMSQIYQGGDATRLRGDTVVMVTFLNTPNSLGLSKQDDISARSTCLCLSFTCSLALRYKHTHTQPFNPTAKPRQTRGAKEKPSTSLTFLFWLKINLKKMRSTGKCEAGVIHGEGIQVWLCCARRGGGEKKTAMHEITWSTNVCSSR